MKRKYKILILIFSLLLIISAITFVIKSNENTIHNAHKGDIVTFGNYEQDGNIENGKEPIEWIVLEEKENKILLISKYSFSKIDFSDTTFMWKNSNIRKWLRNDFYNQAFSDKEKAKITPIKNETNNQETYDSIFLLSTEECEKYFVTSNDAISKLTQQTINEYGNYNGDNTANWWLRDYSYTEIKIGNAKHKYQQLNFVGNDGSIRSSFPKDSEFSSISARPVICVDKKQL